MAGRAAVGPPGRRRRATRAPRTSGSGPSTASTPRRSPSIRPGATTCSIAHEMLGKRVTREHGGPVRLYVAPMYGYKSLKWLERIEVVSALDDPTDPGYWERNGLRRRCLGRALQRPGRRGHVTTAVVRQPARGALHARAALAALEQRHPLPRAPRHGHDPLHPDALDPGRPSRAGEGHPRVLAVCCSRSRCSSPTPVAGGARCATTSVASPGGRRTTGAGCAAWAGAARSGWASSTPARS